MKSFPAIAELLRLLHQGLVRGQICRHKSQDQGTLVPREVRLLGSSDASAALRLTLKIFSGLSMDFQWIFNVFNLFLNIFEWLPNALQEVFS